MANAQARSGGDLASLRVIWIALFAGPLVAGATFLALAPGRTIRVADAPVVPVLLAIAALIEGTAILFALVVAPRPPSADAPELAALRADLAAGAQGVAGDLASLAQRALQPFRARSVIGWAIGEGGALLAAITIFLAGPNLALAGIAALFLLQWLVGAPTRGRATAAVAGTLVAAGLTEAQAHAAAEALR